MQILEIEGDNNNNVQPRVSLERNGSTSSSSSLSCVAPFVSRKSFSYNKLPPEPLKLCVLKLDGSSFDIQVSKTGRVADLKRAVEAAFSHLPQKGIGKVSWNHVWGQFCLSSYEGEKLLNDSAYIGFYGIEDGDQLLFIRHTSINYNLRRTRSDTKDSDSESETSMDRSDSYEDTQDNGVDNNCIRGQENLNHRDGQETLNHCDQQENLKHQCYDADDASDEDNGIITHCEYRFAHLLRQWFSYRRLKNSEMSSEETNSSNSSKLAGGFFSSFRRFCSDKPNYRLETMKGE